MSREHTSDTIDGVFMDNDNASYDATAKGFIARKVFLARILKRCVKEFRKCSLEYIAGSCIEGTPEVSKVPLAPDLTNAPRKIIGDNVEYKTLTEGTTTFDIRFVAYAPDTKEPIKIIVNIEAQKKHNPGYSLIKRGIFHGSRLMSSQYSVEFEEPNFDAIKKVVTIWLCMTSPGDKESGITEYSFRERRLAGKFFRNDRKNYDLIQVVMVYVGKSDAIEDDFLKMLHLLFRARLKAEEKTKRLKDDFDIVLDNDMQKELNIMCNLSEGIAEEARAEAWAEANKLSAGIAEEAMEEGRKLGFKDGEDATTTKYLKHIMQKKQMTLDEAMDMLGIPEDERSQYASLF